MLLQRKAPFDTLLIVTPPVRHSNNLTAGEDDEHEQHSDVETGIERSSNEIVVAPPSLEAVAEVIAHANVSDNEARDVASGQVTIEVRHTGPKDGDIP